MADYSTSRDNANTSLNESTDGGFVEEYQIGNKRVRRGRVTDQVKAAAMLEALAARRSGGLFKLSKFREPRS